MMIGFDKRLLNVSTLDGGYGLTIKGRPPVRAKIVTKHTDRQYDERI